MGIFHDFSIAHILREINFGYCRSAKSAILTHLDALNFDFHEFLHFLKAEITKLTKFRAPKRVETVVLALLDPPKLISCKT